MKLRPADPSDVQALAAVHAQAFDDPWPPEAFAALLAGPGVYAFTATDGEPTALILMRAVADEAEVLTLATAPSHRRRGAGEALLRAGLDRAAALGAESAFLEVAADNAAAIALYARAGFVQVGRRAGYYRWVEGPSADALVLRRTLNSPIP
jgi:ribosomal-protein-alanine N-acetyltransferase